VALFFLAFIPQFIVPGTPDKALAFLGLGAWFVLQSLPLLLAVVAATAWLGRRSASPVLRRWLSAAGAALFGALALRLAAASAEGA
jgi:threonine/homoserine/homoserine lactone efflux protein